MATMLDEAWRAGPTPTATEEFIADGIALVCDEHHVEHVHLALTPEGWEIVNTRWRDADGHDPLG
jgi:hypothetical protein